MNFIAMILRILSLPILVLLMLICLYSCGNEPKCYEYKKVLKIEPQHATRVYVTYVSECNDTIVSSEHWSGIIKCENGTFILNDYLNGKLPYGKIK